MPCWSREWLQLRSTLWTHRCRGPRRGKNVLWIRRRASACAWDANGGGEGSEDRRLASQVKCLARCHAVTYGCARRAAASVSVVQPCSPSVPTTPRCYCGVEGWGAFFG